MSQARQFAASMVVPKKFSPLPSEEHHFSAMKVASCEGVPDEIFSFLAAAKVKLNPLSEPFVNPSANLVERDFKLRQRALRLLSPLLVTRHLSGALARVIQATNEGNNRNALDSIRRLMLANSLTPLGDIRVALFDAVRARQELRQAVCKKAPSHIQVRIMTSEIFTDRLMTDQTWSECNTLLTSSSFLAPAPPPKAKGPGKQKAKVQVKGKTSSKSSVQKHVTSNPSSTSTQVKTSKGRSSFSSSRGKGRGKVQPKETRSVPNLSPKN